VIKVLGALPWFAGIYFLVSSLKGTVLGENASTANVDLPAAVAWFGSPQRLALYVGIRAASAVTKPFLELGPAILFKHLLVGKVAPGPRPTSGKGAFDLWFLKQLFPMVTNKAHSKRGRGRVDRMQGGEEGGEGVGYSWFPRSALSAAALPSAP